MLKTWKVKIEKILILIKILNQKKIEGDIKWNKILLNLKKRNSCY